MAELGGTRQHGHRSIMRGGVVASLCHSDANTGEK